MFYPVLLSELHPNSGVLSLEFMAMSELGRMSNNTVSMILNREWDIGCVETSGEKKI